MLSVENQLTAQIKVRTIYTIGPYLLQQLITQLHRATQQMMLYTKENFTHVLRDKLHNGGLDAIIIALPFEADLLTPQLYNNQFYVLMPASHPWTQKDAIDVGLLNNKSLLLLGRGHCFRNQVLEACLALTRSNDGAKRITVKSSSQETIRHVAASGLKVFIPPQLAVDSHHYAPGSIGLCSMAKPPAASQATLMRKRRYE